MSAVAELEVGTWARVEPAEPAPRWTPIAAAVPAPPAAPSPPAATAPLPPERVCRSATCSRPGARAEIKGWCVPCWKRWVRAGRPESGPPEAGRSRKPRPNAGCSDPGPAPARTPRTDATPVAADDAPPEATPWRQRAACAQGDVNPEWFFPEDPIAVERATAVCRGCPVAAECLAAATAEDLRWSVRGGRAPRRRRGEVAADAA